MNIFKLASVLVVACVAAAMPALSKAHLTPAQEWEAWRKSENAGWSSDKYALLKIDDAVYLKPGESAALTSAGAPVPHYKFTLGGAAAGATLSVANNEPNAIVTRGGKAKTYKLSEKTVHVPLGRGIEFGMQLAQVTPGKMGLRAFVFNQANPLA
jgi:hypothetical protein